MRDWLHCRLNCRKILLTLIISLPFLLFVLFLSLWWILLEILVILREEPSL
jgi:hypothetical protein